MELKTGYKQTEIGVIPSDWEVKTLKELSLLITKGTTPKQFSEAGINYIKIESLVGDIISLERCLFIEESIHKTELKRSILNEGDLLFAIAGATIGKCTFVKKEVIPANTNQALAIIRLKGEENKTYVFYFLKSILMQKYIVDNIAGGAQPNMNLAQIGGYSFPVPPTREEQTAIATALSDTDQYITHLEKLIAKKRNIKQGAMQELLKPKEGWVVRKLGEIADKRIKWSFTGGPFGSNLKSSDYTDDGVRIIQLQNIGDGEFVNNYGVYTSELKADELLSCNIFPGDILLSKMGDPVGRACIVPLLHSRYLMCSDGIRLVVDRSQYNAYFIYVLINFPDFRGLIENASTGSTRKRIGLSQLRRLELLVPELEEQIRIATILSNMDSEITTLETKLSKAKSIKQGMMQQLLTGKIRLI
jgi:type I restriction enzyme S subunit